VSLPQFKETVAFRLEEVIRAEIAYLVEHTQADLAQLRLRQGTIAGLRVAQEIIRDQYKESFG
jgi:hypothetical protein